MATVRLDVALGAQGMTVKLPSGGWRTLPVRVRPGADDVPAALAAAFAGLRSAVGEGSSVALRVALVPPLSDARRVELPPLREEELDAVLHRDQARHFIGSQRPLVVAGVTSHPGLATAAPRGLLESLQAAAAAAGLGLDRVVPAHAAWLRALDAAGRTGGAAAGEGAAAAAQPRLVVAVEDGTAHLILLRGSACERLRRVPAADAAAVMEAAGKGPGAALLLAEADEREALARGLADAGWTLLRTPEPWTAPRAAARFAGEAHPELVPPALVWVRGERSRRLGVRMLGAAALVLVAAAGVHLFGTWRAYERVRAERDAIREAVAPALVARDSLDRMTERLTTLQALGGEASRWTFSLVELAMLLPPETHLVSLRAAGDTAVFEGEGGRAGDALAALRGASGFRDVRLEGQIQREMEGGQVSGERFTLSAVLAPPGGKASPAPSSDVQPEGPR